MPGRARLPGPERAAPCPRAGGSLACAGGSPAPCTPPERRSPTPASRSDRLRIRCVVPPLSLSSLQRAVAVIGRARPPGPSWASPPLMPTMGDMRRPQATRPGRFRKHRRFRSVISGFGSRPILGMTAGDDTSHTGATARSIAGHTGERGGPQRLQAAPAGVSRSPRRACTVPTAGVRSGTRRGTAFVSDDGNRDGPDSVNTGDDVVMTRCAQHPGGRFARDGGGGAR